MKQVKDNKKTWNEKCTNMLDDFSPFKVEKVKRAIFKWNKIFPTILFSFIFFVFFLIIKFRFRVFFSASILMECNCGWREMKRKTTKKWKRVSYISFKRNLYFFILSMDLWSGHHSACLYNLCIKLNKRCCLSFSAISFTMSVSLIPSV